jgi:hypothetical protein
MAANMQIRFFARALAINLIRSQLLSTRRIRSLYRSLFQAKTTAQLHAKIAA